MTSNSCPPFLKPRLRLFLSADIVGSTSLKQARARPGGPTEDSTKGPSWFSAIQGFYFEAAQAFIAEWSERKLKSNSPHELYGDAPEFWKSIGDEVLFTKILDDHRQLVTALSCWFAAVDRIREFLKNEDASLDVKCTAWLAGFPFRNREVVIGKYPDIGAKQVENYYQESGNLLNEIYNGSGRSGLSIDYIGPSIDTGFRLGGFSSSRKMAISLDVAYLISMTNFDGEIARIDIHYDGSQSLKGVLGGAPYPLFWISMSGKNSLADKEDQLRSRISSNKENLKEYCDAFYQEYESFIFRPFIQGDVGQTLAQQPNWYSGYHAKLVKNFTLPDNEYTIEPIGDEYEDGQSDDETLTQVLDDLNFVDSEPYLSQFALNQFVRHHKFGEGLVVGIDGAKVTVKFQDEAGEARERRILDSFLEPSAL